MADILEIVSKEAIDGLLKAAQAAQQLDSAVTSISKSQVTFAEKTKAFNVAQKESEKINKDQTAAIASLEKQRQKAYEQMAKQEAKERELSAAIAMGVKSIQDAEKQNKALLEAKKKLNLTTEEGRKKNEEYNKTLNKNTEFIRTNSDAATKQRMNIGNYKSALEGMPGALGRVGTSMSGLDRVMKVIATTNPFTLILVAVTALIGIISKLWSSTDSGGTKMKALWEGLKAIFDVLIKRAADFVGGLIKIFQGKFKEGAEQMSGAFKGIGDQMARAAKAAHDYEMAMDAINDLHTAFISQEAKLKKEIAELEFIAQNQNKSLSEREAALQAAMTKEIELVEFRRNEAVNSYDALIKKTAAAAGVTEEFVRYLIDADAEMVQVLRETTPEIGKFYDLYEDDIGKLEEAYANTLKADTDYFEQSKRNISKLSGFQKQAAAERAEAAAKAAEIAAINESRSLQITEMARLETEQIITDTHLEHLALREQADIDSAAREDERLKKQYDERIQMVQQYTDMAAQIGNALFSFNAQLLANEQVSLENAKAQELALAGDNADKRARIEKKYDEELRKLRTRQAKADKAQAVFSSIINTAKAVVGALPNIILAAIVGALGAAQTIAIAAQPIPAFAKGTRNAPRGLGLWGERGRELMIGRDGQMIMSPGTASLVNLKGGERILSNRETELIMNAARGADDGHSRKMLDMMHSDNLKLIETVKNKPVIHIDRKGTRINERNGDYFKTYLNRKLG